MRRHTVNGGRTVRSSAMAALVVAAIAGCQKPYTGPYEAQYDEYQPYPTVTLSQASLREAIRITEPRVERLSDGLLLVTLPLRSASDEPIHVEWRIEFLDKRGVPIEPRMNWRPLRLEPRQPESISAGSTSGDAENYNVQLRWGLP